jgi:hypothetical protein
LNIKDEQKLKDIIFFNFASFFFFFFFTYEIIMKIKIYLKIKKEKKREANELLLSLDQTHVYQA